MRDASPDHLHKAPAGYLEKIMGTVAAGDSSSTKNHDDHGQVINSSEFSNVKTNRGRNVGGKRESAPNPQ